MAKVIKKPKASPMRVNREDFLRRLDEVRVGLSPKEMIEQSNCFAFADGDVFTFNEETACRTTSGLPKDFRGAVQADPLLKILHKMPEEEILVTPGKNELVIKGRNRGAAIVMDKEIKLPVDTVDKPKKWTTLHEDFADAVTIVKECAGKDDSAIKSTCLHLHPKWMEACDTLQITRYTLPTGVAASVLIKKDSIQHVPALDMTEMSETDGWLHFRNSSGLILSCLKYAESYPDTAKYLDVKGTPAVLPKGLAEAVEKAEIFSSEDKDNNKILVELRRGKLRIRGIGVTGRYWEIKDVKYGGEPIGFAVSPKLLVEIVRRHTKCEISKKHRLKVNGGKFTYVAALEKL